MPRKIPAFLGTLVILSSLAITFSIILTWNNLSLYYRKSKAIDLPTSPAPTLIFTFDGTLAGSNGSSNIQSSETASGNPPEATTPSFVPGVKNLSLSLTRTDYVAYNLANFDPQNFAVTFWLKPKTSEEPAANFWDKGNNTQTCNFMKISKNDEPANNFFQIGKEFQAGKNKIYLKYSVGGVENKLDAEIPNPIDPNNRQVNPAGGTLPIENQVNPWDDKNWHLLEFSVKNGQSASFFLDGVLQRMEKINAGLAQNTNYRYQIGQEGLGETLVDCEFYLDESKIYPGSISQDNVEPEIIGNNTGAPSLISPSSITPFTPVDL